MTADDTGQGRSDHTTPSVEPPDSELPDDRDLDEGGLDLTPRTAAAPARRSPVRRRWGAIAVLVALAGVLVFIVVQARGASLYYHNADEAVAQKSELGQPDRI